MSYLSLQTTTCRECGQEIYYGDWPFCPHGPAHDRDAAQFTPIVVHRKRLEDGQFVYSYPARSDDPPDPGYEPVSLNSLAEADRFVKDRDAEEREIRREHFRRENDYWDERRAERRATQDQILHDRLGHAPSPFVQAMRQLIDLRRKVKRQKIALETNFHNKAISFDSSKLRDYKDDRSGPQKKISVVVQGFRR